MQLLPITIAAELDPTMSVVGTIASVVISFVTITLIASYYRFQAVVEKAENTQPEDMGSTSEEVLRVQLARYLAGCARRGTSFSFSLIQVRDEAVPVRMDSPLIQAIKGAVRRDDITYVYDERTAALFTETEPEDSEAILSRVVSEVVGELDGLGSDALRVGVASYPGHGLSGRELLDTALEALGRADEESPIVMPEIIDEDEEAEAEKAAAAEELVEDDEDEAKSSEGWRKKRENAMLDEVTGVLKPSAISPYMQRQMNEFRRKKLSVALFCVGVNNMEHITRFHGEKVANDVLAGVSRVLQESLRSDDLIGRHETHAFLVLARCTLEEAELIGHRVSTEVQNANFHSGAKKLKTQITVGVAVFPEHGKNLHYLYTAGQKVLDHSRANDIRAYSVYDPEIHDKMEAKPMRNIKSIQA